jgi:hypothetical protein
MGRSLDGTQDGGCSGHRIGVISDGMDGVKNREVEWVTNRRACTW